jgi:hypothetical protein
MRLAQLINPIPGTHTVDNIATIKGLEWIFQNIVTSILSFAGIVLFILLIVGGFKYLTSGGNPESVASAQKTLTYAILGIVLIALSYLILVLIEYLTGANVTVFSVTA